MRPRPWPTLLGDRLSVRLHPQHRRREKKRIARHRIGQMKRKYMEAEHGSEALDLMRTLKRAIDPANIMNPGKVFAA